MRRSEPTPARLERERREGRTVLFPIRLDEQVVETDEAWAADIRRTRHIGDFRGRQGHDAYARRLTACCGI